MAKARLKGKPKTKVRIEPKDADQAPDAEGVEIDISANTEEMNRLYQDLDQLEKEAEALKKEYEELKAENEAEALKKENEERKAGNEAEALQKEVEELKDRDLRRQAEFENFRKRTEKEKSQQFDAGAAHVLEKILPVLDNFERGFQSVEEADKDDAFVEGMNKVYKQLTDEMEKLGVVPIEAVGKEFDPNIHNAVMQVDTGEVASGFVAQEMQKGYMYHDTVLRFSMVAVQQ